MGAKNKHGSKSAYGQGTRRVRVLKPSIKPTVALDIACVGMRAVVLLAVAIVLCNARLLDYTDGGFPRTDSYYRCQVTHR